MGFVQGVNRNQVVMFPESLDEYVAADNPVRFINAFVDNLDLHSLGFERARPEERGRPPYHPGDLLKLYVYGYLNRVRSSRRLEKEAQRNVELMWLLGKLAPDHKTIADFRRDNGKPIRAIFREFTVMCRRLELYGGQLVAIDGSKFKASNSRDRNFTQAKLERLNQRADKEIERYLKELDETDEQEQDNEKPTAEELQAKIDWLRGRKQEYEKLQGQMAESGEKQVSLTDPDARSMVLGSSRGTEVAYNMQISVDAKHKLIVDYEVTNAGNDKNQLSTMAMRAKEALAVESLEVVADQGYYSGKEIRDCVEGDIQPYIRRPNISNSRGRFAREEFRYDADKDCYWCPRGKALPFKYQTIYREEVVRDYIGQECGQCALKSQCTKSKTGRRIRRRVEEEELLQDMARRVHAEPDKVKQRKSIVEHPFGTIKRSMDQGYFLTRGLLRVRTEASLTMLAYNIQRVLRLKGVQELLATVSS
jgi:transposase